MDGKKPLVYRPQPHDDWGIIRDADGDLAARACGPEFYDHDLCEGHRTAGTDPVEERAREIVRAVNCHDDLVAALKNARQALEAAVRAYASQTEVTDHRIIQQIDAALTKVEQST